jgi:hypothetical protein
MASAGLRHPQVDVDLGEVERKLDESEYQLDANDQRGLWANKTISQVWPESPHNEQLRVFVRLSSGMGSPTRVHAGECFIRLFALAQDI